jgi:uncharacterized DUF497 family protein
VSCVWALAFSGVLTLYILCNKLSSKTIEWDEAKNALLKRLRGISFEEIVETLAKEGPLWIKEHPRPEKYPGQKLFAVSIESYVFIVPIEETDEKIIFKTIYPSRRATRAHRKSRGKNEG